MSEQDRGDFIDRYLEHLERRDSREGATKWLIVAAIAAVLWQISLVLFKVDLVLTGQLVSIFLSLYFAVEFSGVLFSGVGESGRVKFKRRTEKDSSVIGLVSVRFLVTGASFYFFFQGLPDAYRYMVSVPPALLGGAFLLLTLGHLTRKYDVLKPPGNAWPPRIFGLLVFVFPVVWGLYNLFPAMELERLLSDSGNLGTIQASGLFIVIFFLAEKYAKTLRADGEVLAVQRIWRKRGIGEISPEEAAKELRLIIAGASLSEVISHAVNALSQALQALEDTEDLAKQELAKLQAMDAEDHLIENALRNSLQKRASDIACALAAVEARREEILQEIKRLLDDEALSEVEELKASLDERCSSRRKSADAVTKEISNLRSAG